MNLRYACTTEISEETYTINVPSLFIGGSRDTLFPEAVSLVPMHKYATNLKVVSLDAGHYLHIERADEVNKALEAQGTGVLAKPGKIVVMV